jgi:methionyl aminopeptidase
MIIGKSKKELEKMRAAGRLAGQVREELRRMARAGVTTRDLDRAAERMIRDAGALPTFKGYHGYPYSICASVNEQVVHGFPSDYVLEDGDIISIDVGATLDGFVGDTATTVPVGNVSEAKLRLIRVAEECLERAIEQCRHGKHLGDIGWAVQELAEAEGYALVRDYGGHGIGRKMHEDPHIPNYGRPGTDKKIKNGYVLNMGTHHTKTLSDGWTVVTVDGQPSAHVEHTIAITEEGPQVLTRMPEELERLKVLEATAAAQA